MSRCSGEVRRVAAALAVNNPLPAITALSPGSIAAGTTTPKTVTISGTSFVSGATVQVNGFARATAFASATQLSFQLTASDQALGANLSVVVVNPARGGGASTLTGTDFVGATVIQVAGSSRATTFLSATQLTFQLTAEDLSTGGSLSITAVNPLPGGGTSGAATIAVNYPVPGPLSLTPDAVATGTPVPLAVIVTGTNFVAGSSVQVNGSPRATIYVSGTKVSFQLTVADQAATANLSITVVNPTPGGGASPASILTVGPGTPAAVLTSVTPNQIVVNSPDTTLSVLGTGLTGTSVVQWNGTSLATSLNFCYVFNSYVPCLSATVPASLLTALETANITVYSPTTTPTVSNTLQVAVINPPVPTSVSLSVSAGPVNTAISIGLTGTGFASTSSALLNGTAVPTTFVNSTSLSINVPASSLATPGVFPVTVVTPAPGGGTSTPQYFTAYLNIPNNSMVYNPANGLFYLSAPSAAGAPYGNTIVSVDPLTGSTGTPIPRERTEPAGHHCGWQVSLGGA